MISDATMKLLVGSAIGVIVFYKYKKNHIKQKTLEKPHTIGFKKDAHFDPNVLNKHVKDISKHFKLGRKLKPTAHIKPFHHLK